MHDHVRNLWPLAVSLLPWQLQLIRPKTIGQQIPKRSLSYSAFCYPSRQLVIFLRQFWLRIIAGDEKNGHVEGAKFAEDLATYSTWRNWRTDVARRK